jgi:hypothetical protein
MRRYKMTERYVNSIFEKQSERDMKDLIHSYATENGLSTQNIDSLIAGEQEYCFHDPYGGLRYSRGQIINILKQL